MVTAAMKLKGTIFGRQAMTNLNSTLKSRDITLLTKAHLVKAMVFSVTMYGCESWPIKKAECWRIDAFELWCWKRLLRVPWTARRSNQSILKESVLNIHGNYWCWSWNSNTVATCCQKRTHWEKTWCWERLKVGGEGDDRGWDAWMESPSSWRWVWASFSSWWWTGKPGVLQSMGLQRVRHNWVTELNWSHLSMVREILRPEKQVWFGQKRIPCKWRAATTGGLQPWLFVLSQVGGLITEEASSS